ncbi:MAG: DUF3800 domain-containing protein [Gemmataceae bacterium]|nr:DUF3800 domain-containing protein [Gemmataceae bacterium]
MAWLLFLDESGHDHKQMPYEVRGGIALQDSQLWPFTRAIQQLERECFGCSLHDFQKELKGSTLLDKKRFKFANQAAPMSAAERQKHARAFLMKGFQKQNPTSSEFCAYGQACVEMARGLFQLLRDHKAVLFASMIPRGTGKATEDVEDYLRKDKVFLLERFFYFLEREKQNGLLVLDGTDKNLDRKFVRQLEGYFAKTNTGRYRTQWIVPTPYYVASDMAYPVQVADLCIYCVNWAFRLPTHGMTEPVRDEIKDEFFVWLRSLQFHGDGYKDGRVFAVWGICYVPNPCAPGRDGS